jgi:hypothetical protein
MSNLNLRSITNNFGDVQLASLASWKGAAEFGPHDRGGPYVVIQQGYDPEDATVTPDEFVLGRSGRWMSLSLFYRLPVPERRAEFVYATAAEVMATMSTLPAKPQFIRPGKDAPVAGAVPEEDEMVQALKAARGNSPGDSSTGSCISWAA